MIFKEKQSGGLENMERKRPRTSASYSVSLSPRLPVFLSVFCALLLAATGPLAGAFEKSGPEIESKKGLQVQMVDDALALGVHHAAINVDFVQLAAANSAPENEAMLFEGERFEFKRRVVEELDAKVRPFSSHGITVYLILLAYKTSNPDLARAFIHPKFNAASEAPISAFSTNEKDTSRHFRASISFLARRYARPDAPPVHFIVGNEVNSHWFWYNMGEASMEAVAEEYERAVRLCHDAVSAVSPASRVYLSLDQNWNASATPKEPLKSFGARAFLEAFAALARRNGDFEWHLAFHPYPENLFEPRTWNDRQATMAPDTPKITFRNIELLNEFMKRPELAFMNKARRIILSEQGFHTTLTPDGELVQAAAYAYAYRKVAQLDGIDAFILHRHVDHAHEGGLNLGLWTGDKDSNPVKKKMIYDVFRLADTKEWENAFKFALPVIGIKDWSELK